MSQKLWFVLFFLFFSTKFTSPTFSSPILRDIINSYDVVVRGLRVACQPNKFLAHPLGSFAHLSPQLPKPLHLSASLSIFQASPVSFLKWRSGVSFRDADL
jgi:hypothetical protein